MYNTMMFPRPCGLRMSQSLTQCLGNIKIHTILMYTHTNTCLHTRTHARSHTCTHPFTPFTGVLNTHLLSLPSLF